jgi:hypothetical protein
MMLKGLTIPSALRRRMTRRYGSPSMQHNEASLTPTTRAGRGPGWTHAQVKRMAKKRRNVLRNRRAHRGRG